MFRGSSPWHEIDWYAAEGALGVWDLQQRFSLVIVRMGPEEGPYREN
jgi:hypothetical protein